MREEKMYDKEGKLKLNMKECEKENCQICKDTKEGDWHRDCRYMMALTAGGKLICHRFKCKVRSLETKEHLEFVCNEIMHELWQNDRQLLKEMILEAYENTENHR